MSRAVDLLSQGKDNELWQMCLGFLDLSLPEFMAVQKRLMEQQLFLLNSSGLGKRLFHGARPETVEEFRDIAPLTTYKDYGESFFTQQETDLPGKPEYWVRTSGRTGDYPCKWVPMAPEFQQELSVILYGIGMLSCCNYREDTSRIPAKINLLYSVAPRPYISGTFANVLRLQTPLNYLPPLEEAEKLNFEQRLGLGFQQALNDGLDYFFGLSLVLAMIGDKLKQSSAKIDVSQYIKKPKALARLVRAFIKSRLQGRKYLLPKDLWSIRGIVGSGVDSWIYKDKVREFWGRNPLDLYACTEGGVIATQAWDYSAMTFIPNLNFLEFIPEDELLKWQMDRSYKMQTVLLDEVRAGEIYELVITNFHGGAMTRYRIGDMVRITALQNAEQGINLPQMVFERRVDDLISFMVIKLSEKQIWQAIERSGIPYVDWAAYKIPGETELNILIEPAPGYCGDVETIRDAITREMIATGKSSYDDSGIQEDWRDELGFSVNITLLQQGTFANYTALKQSEGADPAHLKPPHINPPQKVLDILLADVEEIVVEKRQEETDANETSEKSAVIDANVS